MRYPSDLTDEQWQLIQPLFPKPARQGRPREHPYRCLVDACFYLARTGCQWRQLPNDLPPWPTVSGYFYRWVKQKLWEKINTHLREKARVAEGRKSTPTAGIIDSQTIKSTECCEARGYDAGKKINGRKRHVVVDTLGLLLWVLVLPGNVQDRDGAKLLLAAVFARFGRLKQVWADGGYTGQLVQWVQARWQRALEIVKRSDSVKGFKVLPRRWVVERTFGWLGRYRRLSKDDERKDKVAETMIYLAMSRLMLLRLTK